jgi:hypothetical protein
MISGFSSILLEPMLEILTLYSTMYQEHYFCPDDPSPYLAGPKTQRNKSCKFHVQNPDERSPRRKTSVVTERSESTSPVNFRPYITFSSSLLKQLHSQNPLLGVGDALERSLGVLDNLLNSADVLVGLLLGGLESRVVLLAGVVEENAGGLGGTDAEEQEVDGGEEQVARLDDEAPASPDQTGGGQGGVLGEGEVLCGTGEVGGAGEDETPLLEE